MVPMRALTVVRFPLCNKQVLPLQQDMLLSAEGLSDRQECFHNQHVGFTSNDWHRLGGRVALLDAHSYQNVVRACGGIPESKLVCSYNIIQVL